MMNEIIRSYLHETYESTVFIKVTIAHVKTVILNCISIFAFHVSFTLFYCKTCSQVKEALM